MAIWQYTFRVLQKESVEILSPDLNFGKCNDVFDDESYWKLNPVKGDFFNAVQKILPRTSSWSNDIDLFGNQESNCFEVLFDKDGYVLSVSFRIDFTSKYENILSHIIEFCGLNGLIILDESLNIVPWDFDHIRGVIRNSLQVSKCKDLSSKDKED